MKAFSEYLALLPRFKIYKNLFLKVRIAETPHRVVLPNLFRVAGDGLDGRLIDDIHVAAGLFKSLLRELSEPLIPFSAYSALVDRNEEMKQMNVRLKVFKTILSNIPSLNRQVIEEIMRLAQKIALNAATRMNPRNLVRCAKANHHVLIFLTHFLGCSARTNHYEGQG